MQEWRDRIFEGEESRQCCPLTSASWSLCHWQPADTLERQQTRGDLATGAAVPASTPTCTPCVPVHMYSLCHICACYELEHMIVVTNHDRALTRKARDVQQLQTWDVKSQELHQLCIAKPARDGRHQVSIKYKFPRNHSHSSVRCILWWSRCSDSGRRRTG